MLAATFGTGQVAFSLLWFFLFLIEIWLIIVVFTDIFRSNDLRGWAKALWAIFILVFPLVGILAYLIIRGDKMRVHQIQWLDQQERMFRNYIRQVAHEPTSIADEIQLLAELREKGDLSEVEFQALKERLLASKIAA